MKRLRYLLAAILVLLTATTLARVGGGQSYSGGGYSRSSSSSSSGSYSSSGGSYSSSGSSSHSSGDAQIVGFLLELLIRLIFYYPKIGIPLLIMLIWGFYKYNGQGVTAASKTEFQKLQDWSSDNIVRQQGPPNLDTFKKSDPNFSSPMFLDFLTLLYCKAYLSAGEAVAPYLSDSAKSTFTYKDVSSIVIGGVKVIRALSRNPKDLVEVEIEANLSFENGQKLFIVESVILQRDHGINSLEPDVLYSLSCPSCGSKEGLGDDGSCKFCQKQVNDGRFSWILTSRRRQHSTAVPPVVLSASGVELGTDLPTVKSPTLQKDLVRLQQSDPEFTTTNFEDFARTTFLALQEAWTSMEWDRARPLETDFLFQQHQYWVEAYKFGGFRNVLEDVSVSRVELAKIDIDKFFESITIRIFASMKDYTIREANKDVVSGFPDKVRSFSEYWTFVRRAGVTTQNREAANCPSCGAPLDKVSQAGDCEYCGARITRGDFDWILSRIEQDEAYH